MVLGVVLILCGGAIAIPGVESVEEHVDLHPSPEWRGWACILGGVASFILLARNLGLFPATFSCVFISALGDRSVDIKHSALLAFALAVIGVLVFHYLLGIQLPPFAWMRS